MFAKILVFAKIVDFLKKLAKKFSFRKTGGKVNGSFKKISCF
jgi:hypothetical protein